VERGTLTSEGLCVAETFHLVEEALRSPCRVAAILAAESVAARAEAISGHAEIVVLSDALFATVAATEASQGVMALVEPRAWTVDEILSGRVLALLLDGIQDPGNAGTIIRAAEAFSATGVVLLKGTVSPYNPKAVRASAGSLFRLPVVAGAEAETAVRELRERDIALLAATPRAEVLAADVDFTGACAIAIGSEGRGVGPVVHAAAVGVRIPTVAVESLNAAVSAAVLLYEAARQRSA
jgi:RNA methyltransferase, TrmH family